MATSSSFSAGFDAARFRTAISNTMLMGLPESTAERATFRWTTEKTYSVADAAGQPFDWTAAPATTTSHVDVQVPVAVEFSGNVRGSADTVIGQFDVPKAIITILDTDYPSVEGADQVILGGNTYVVDFVAPPIGLFGVTIYQIFTHALDES